MQKPDRVKSKARESLLKIWGISHYPTKLTHALFEMAWNKVREKHVNTTTDIMPLLEEEGLMFVELLLLCSEVFVGNDVHINKKQLNAEVFAKLKQLTLLGSIKMTRSNMGRYVIEWQYKISSSELLKVSPIYIRHLLYTTKSKDVLKMSSVLNSYKYQVQEQWDDISKGAIFCYIGQS